MNIAFFDFDGTISHSDSLPKFIRFAVGDFAFLVGMLVLLPTLVLYGLKLISNNNAKEKMLSYFFKGMDEQRFLSLAQQYAALEIDKIVRSKAVERIFWHIHNGDKVVVVSASLEYWLSGWCKKMGLELVATKFELSRGVLTGRFDGENCHGDEKVKRIIARYDLSRFSSVYAYGDSAGDRPMLALAGDGLAFYKPFR